MIELILRSDNRVNDSGASWYGQSTFKINRDVPSNPNVQCFIDVFDIMDKGDELSSYSQLNIYYSATINFYNDLKLCCTKTIKSGVFASIGVQSRRILGWSGYFKISESITRVECIFDVGGDISQNISSNMDITTFVQYEKPDASQPINISRSEDIHNSDRELWKKFSNLFISGNYYEAFGVVDTNNSLAKKKIISEILNQIRDGIIIMEDKYDQDYIKKMYEYLQILQNNIDNYIIYNTYSDTQQYEIFNYVTDGTEWYFCYKRPPIGIEPTNTDYWVQCNLKGETGDNSLGVSLVLQPNYWDSNKKYEEKQTVHYDFKNYQNSDYYNTAFFVSRQENTRKQPIENKDDWMQLIKVRREHIESGDSEPESIDYPPFPINGTIWWQIVK